MYMSVGMGMWHILREETRDWNVIHSDTEVPLEPYDVCSLDK